MFPADEFYIGWEAKAPPSIGRTLRKAVLALVLLALLTPVVLAVSQRMIGASVFEWGMLKSFAGILENTPYPHLLVPRPGRADGLPGYSSYYLVAPWKFGLPPGAIANLDGKWVTLKGTLIYRDNQTMIEVRPESIQSREPTQAMIPVPATVPLGKRTLVGEIVDSKCYLGVMNPGRLAPHRACAIRCLSGGCPPVFVVRRMDGPQLYFLLVSAAGKPVNEQVLDKVAEPLEITGEVERQGELLILRADPADYHRVAK